MGRKSQHRDRSDRRAATRAETQPAKTTSGPAAGYRGHAQPPAPAAPAPRAPPSRNLPIVDPDMKKAGAGPEKREKIERKISKGRVPKELFVQVSRQYSKIGEINLI
jgi:hypothetical protein